MLRVGVSPHGEARLVPGVDSPSGGRLWALEVDPDEAIDEFCGAAADTRLMPPPPAKPPPRVARSSGASAAVSMCVGG